MMELIENMMEEFCLMQELSEPDGSGGLNSLGWGEGPRFMAAITLNSTMEAVVAEREGVTSVYRVTTKKSILLKYHNVIKRIRDGKIFRITSDADDKLSPNYSSLDIARCTAERWELT